MNSGLRLKKFIRNTAEQTWQDSLSVLHIVLMLMNDARWLQKKLKLRLWICFSSCSSAAAAGVAKPQIWNIYDFRTKCTAANASRNLYAICRLCWGWIKVCKDETFSIASFNVVLRPCSRTLHPPIHDYVGFVAHSEHPTNSVEQSCRWLVASRSVVTLRVGIRARC